MSTKPFWTILVIAVIVLSSSTSNLNITSYPSIEYDDNSFIALSYNTGILKFSIRNNTFLPGIDYKSLKPLRYKSLTFDWTRQTFFYSVRDSIQIVPFEPPSDPIDIEGTEYVRAGQSPYVCYFEHVDRYLYVFFGSKFVNRFDPYIPDMRKEKVLELEEYENMLDLVVDPCGSMMYWVHLKRRTGSTTIQRASSITGLNKKIETIVDTESHGIRSLSIDPVLKELYWTDHDGTLGSIEMSDLDGKNRITIVKSQRGEIGIYYGLAVTKKFIYYGGAWSVSLYRASRNGRNGAGTEIQFTGRLNNDSSIVYVNRRIEFRNQCVWRPDLRYRNTQTAQGKFTFGLGQQNRSLGCVYTNPPDDTGVKWTHNGHNIDLGLVKFGTITFIQNGTSESLITFKEVKLSDEGNYTCRISNGILEKSLHFVVKICSSCVPKIDKSESKMVFSEGTETQVLTCKYNATSQPNVTWIRNGQTMAESNSTYNGEIGETIIRFTKINTNDGGIYTCSAVNEFGEDFFEINVEVVGGESERESLEENVGSEIIFVLTGTGIVILAVTLILGYLLRKRISRKNVIIKLTDGETQDFYNGKPEAEVSNPNDCGNITALAIPFDQKNEISWENLVIGTGASLGEGQFGLVLRGTYQDRPVAVKTVKPNSDVAYLRALLSEIKIMAFVGNHKGIVEFIGAHTSKIQENVVYMVVELSPVGDLHSYLQRQRPTFLEYSDKVTDMCDSFKCPMNQKHFVNWSMQIADGMKYLEGKNVVHADLATRNILMFPDDVVKISDFGLSRQLYGYTKYTKKSKSPLPFRLMALESLRFMEFTSQSDVWSFGVTIWEIFSLGEVPFPEFTWSAKFVQFLVQELRLPKPDHATAAIYKEMLKCWEADPKKRTTFEELVNFFRTKLHQPQQPNLPDVQSNEGRYIDSEEVIAHTGDACRSNIDLPSAHLGQCLVFTDNSESSAEFGENTAIYLSV